MRPTPIPPEEVWVGAEQHIIAPPGGDMLHETIDAVDVLYDENGIHVRMLLEPQDIYNILSGRTVFWYTQCGRQLQVFSMDWADEPAEPLHPLAVPTDAEIMEQALSELAERFGLGAVHAAVALRVADQAQGYTYRPPA